MNVRYKEWDCVVNIAHYGNGRPAILLETEQGLPVATATVNISFFKPAEGEVLIKDYSENEGILDCLADAGILEPTGKELWSGHAKLHICRLLHPVTEMSRH
ncbi:MAG: hypothetical protein KZQ85_10835 [Candidatus Thiodiazotropha sp. (ex Myrtea sp. 'scaly one' KF741663)]|nr:hypothetical protein [Candidatus Thiodiazotropha sp. (ex Myrtea sp. 'scaly one' KF741663)]